MRIQFLKKLKHIIWKLPVHKNCQEKIIHYLREDMEAADEIQKETIIKDDDVALGNGDVSSSADLSLEEPSPGLHFRIIMILFNTGS